MAKFMFEFTICSDNWEPNGIIKFLGIEKENFHIELSLMIEALSGEREQIRKNIINGVTPTNNVYNPTLGTYDFSLF